MKALYCANLLSVRKRAINIGNMINENGGHCHIVLVIVILIPCSEEECRCEYATDGVSVSE